MSNQKHAILCCVLALVVVAGGAAFSADVEGYILDTNWYAWDAPYAQTEFGYTTAPTAPGEFGTPWRDRGEYGVAGNRNGDETYPGFGGNTENYAENYFCGEFGYFRKAGMGDGTYTMATWSRWWRPGFLFGVDYPWTLANKPIIRIHANMLSYGTSWPGNTYTPHPPGAGDWNELGQTFVASGSAITMITIRMPLSGKDITATVHDGGPGGPQVGPARSWTTSSGPNDKRLFYCGTEMPTIPGRTYYLKLKASGTQTVLFCESEPIPDLSDPMPNGCIYRRVSPSDLLVADPQRDLGLIICSDDDGIVTDLNIDKGSTYPSPAPPYLPLNVTRLGQTFTARGTSLIYFAAFLVNNWTDYVATLYDSVGGTKIGIAKKNTWVRGADPEVLFTWAPGECPLTPGNTYYLEITRSGGGATLFTGSSSNEYSGGECYVERVATGWDISGCIMEEESQYSAIWPEVKFTTYPAVAVADRAARSVTVRWTTDLASDSSVEYGPWNATYADTYYSSALVTSHTATITGLLPNTIYHFRVKSAKSGWKPGVTRDLVTCTINENPNLLVNPGFETVPPGPPNHYRTIPAPWQFGGNLGNQAGDGSYFASIPPYDGAWFACPAVSGTGAHGYAYQTVAAIPGVAYNFSAALYSHNLFREKKDVYPGTTTLVYYNKFKNWQFDREADYLKIGIDPMGGTDNTSASIVWTPTMYSHDHWSLAGVSATASANLITVFVKIDNELASEFHVYGIDDCRLSGNYPAATAIDVLKGSTPDGLVSVGDLIITALPSEVGAYYAETSDRTQGIRIVSTQTVARGTKVAVTGTLTTDPLTGERYIWDAGFTGSASDTEPKSLEMQCQSLGGSALGSLIPAVPGSKGPHNTGLLVTIAGNVTQKAGDGSYIYVNDGSLADPGVKVATGGIPAGSLPAVGKSVSVRGISTLWLDGSVVKPFILPRAASDIAGPYN